MDLQELADSVGADGSVTITGAGTRGGAVDGVRCVTAPSGIDWIQADEMTVQCGAATEVEELSAALLALGQRVVLPDGGTVGGALSVGRSGLRRLGDGPMRDVLLQARYVGADGAIVKAGGPTVKNVSGFDVCRLLVGSRGTLGFLGEVILRTRPIAQCSQWFRVAAEDPAGVFAVLYRPVSVLWDGSSMWALLEGHPDDVREQAARASMVAADVPPALPSGARLLAAPSTLGGLRGRSGFVAELGVGVVHVGDPAAFADLAAPAADPGVRALRDRVKHEFDPTGRLNPGVVVG